jgi:hypothetical protein
MLTKNVYFHLTIFILFLFNFLRCNCSPPASTCYNDCTRLFVLKIANYSQETCSFSLIDDDYDDEFSSVDQQISNDTFKLVPGGTIIDTITYTWTGVDGCYVFKGSNAQKGSSGHATKISCYSGASLRFQKYVYPYDTLHNMTDECGATLFTCGEKKCVTEYTGELIIK